MTMRMISFPPKMKKTMNYRDCYKEGVKRLSECGIIEAELDARLLLEYICKTDRNTLLAHPEREVSEEEYRSYEEVISRRQKREPLQYITGEQEFMGLRFETGRETLIPRQDTECLVEEVMKNLHDGMEILDVCCGTGCILLSLLHYSNDCKGVGVDINGHAVKLAEKNAEALGIQADFKVSDLFEKVDGTYDIIVSNPPYIPSKVIDTLEPEVRTFEPMAALDGGEDGLTFYRLIVKEAKKYLKRGAMVFVEIGFDQGESVPALFEEEGYKNVKVIRDLAGLDRVVEAHFY